MNHVLSGSADCCTLAGQHTGDALLLRRVAYSRVACPGCTDRALTGTSARAGCQSFVCPCSFAWRLRQAGCKVEPAVFTLQQNCAWGLCALRLKKAEAERVMDAEKAAKREKKELK